MAEVHLAVREGLGGFQKLVVIKRILKPFCQNERFVKMFLDEARLAASLQHPNIVQIHDLGEDRDGLFIVMEYLAGETLAYILEELAEKDTLIEPAHVCRIGGAVAAGLHHAHSVTDADGARTAIVHRDVTPSNVIVCRTGVIKLVDFGVAKATNRGHAETRTGTIKGKVPYLSPEQILEREVDERADVFQLGIVLHEMLTGCRLFKGKSDHEIMMSVLQGEVLPPSQVNPRAPSILDDIVMAALARKPCDRTESANILRMQLEQAAQRLGPPASEHDLGQWVHDTFPERCNQRRKLELQWSAGCIGDSHRIDLADDDVSVDTEASADVLDRLESAATVVHGVPTGARRRSTLARIGSWRLGVSAACLFAVAGFSVWLIAGVDSRPAQSTTKSTPLKPSELVKDAAPKGTTRQSGPVSQPHYAVRIRATPKKAAITLNGEVIGRGGLSIMLPTDGQWHRLHVSASGYEAKSIEFSDALDRVIRLKPEATAVQKPRKRLRTKPRRKRHFRATPTAQEPQPRQPELVPEQPGSPPAQEQDWLPKEVTSDNLNPWSG